jgi:hypothetical protein
LLAKLMNSPCNCLTTSLVIHFIYQPRDPSFENFQRDSDNVLFLWKIS